MKDQIICTVEQGKLRGKKDFDLDGKPYFKFQGIPYAKPPTGALRFKAPEPPEKWEGIRDATKEGDCCYSKQIIFGYVPKLKIQGSEDCLVLNVFTRELLKNESNTLKPVMVYIHGGAFCSGSSAETFFGPQYLMTEDIVLVTLNYRLASLGFLVIDDPSLQVTGNAGLKDQVAALKWVQKNIKQFRGDPDNVTIFGQSAGAVSVHYLILSPAAQGLFHKAILQSGSIFCSFAHGLNDAKRLAKDLGCKETDNRKILEFLQNVRLRKIVKAESKQLKTWLKSSTFQLFTGPTVEEKTKNSLLSEEPLKLISSGSYNHVPVIFGYTSREAIIEGLPCYLHVNKKLKYIVPYYFGYSYGSKEYNILYKKISQFYFGKDKPNACKVDIYYSLFTDATFLHGIYKSVKLHAKTSSQPVYFYTFSAETKLNFFKRTMAARKGASHCDDLAYLFKLGNLKFKRGSIEETCVRRLVKMWTNFATCSKPIPAKDSLLPVDWKPVSVTNIRYLDIGTELVAAENPEPERMKFWEEITKGIKLFY